MNSSNNSKAGIFAAGVGGLIVGALLTGYFGADYFVSDDQPIAENTPLYWVAPMDSNYRRDKPGQSPMGMDLIPVYEQGSNTRNTDPGMIFISPEVVNNLGVRTGIASLKPLQREIVTVGYVQYDENKLIHIHPRVSGWVEKLFVKAAGDLVDKGAPVYSLYSPELVNAQEELVLATRRNNTRLIQASESRLQALQLSNAFIAELKRTLKIRQTVNFYAPQSGVVDNLNIREGFFVQPGTTMLSIGALDQVWVEAEIFERQSSLVKTDDPVTMTLDYLPGLTWTGKVDYIYPTLDSQTRTVRIRLRFDNPERKLKPNMFAQITVHTDSEEKLLVIPREALVRTGNQDRVVLALGEGSFKSVEVRRGRSDQQFVEIIEGLQEGEKVVTSAQFLLDSESSKASDFKRMHYGERNSDSAGDGSEIPRAEAQGIINRIDRANRSLNISRGPVEKWRRPAATLDFQVNSRVNLDSLKPGMDISFSFEVRDGNFIVTRLNPKQNQQMDHSGGPDHQDHRE